MTPITALGSRYGIQGALGRSVKRAAVGGGWWDLNGTITSCVAAYQPKGAADLAASYVNLAHPGTYDCALGTAPTFDASYGWSFATVSSQYLKTGVAPTNNQTWSMIVRYSDAAASVGCIAGAVGNSPYPEFKICGRYTSDVIRVSNGNNQEKAPSLLAGVLAVAGTTAYRNGALDITDIGAITGTIPQIYIGARDLFGTSLDEKATVKVQALAIYNATLTSTQVGLLTTAMAAL